MLYERMQLNIFIVRKHLFHMQLRYAIPYSHSNLYGVFRKFRAGLGFNFVKVALYDLSINVTPSCLRIFTAQLLKIE